ncbi:hypothetical protein V6N12_070501 [Hibiscus sabdariffa]|uniref:Uncharacterized protein n=1 Tax=Hibiscus sabdariffa TaxID=183260 RepID=A0ABR2FGZ5_9ROSI
MLGLAAWAVGVSKFDFFSAKEMRTCFQRRPVMVGYLKDPAATSSCMREDGLFYTGYVGAVDPDVHLDFRAKYKQSRSPTNQAVLL